MWSPDFCKEEMKKKIISLLVKTLFFYKIKWQNDQIRDDKQKGQNKLRKLKHQ